MKKLFYLFLFIFLFFTFQTQSKISGDHPRHKWHKNHLKKYKKGKNGRKLYCGWWCRYWKSVREKAKKKQEAKKREEEEKRRREDEARRKREEEARRKREAAQREAERLERVRRAQIERGPKPEICNLAIELHPLYYYPITRMQEFVIAFTSNCLMKKEIFFQMKLDDNKHLNWNYHPTSINLRLWDNYYMIDYKSPRTLDRYDVMKSLEYTQAKISHIIKEKDNIITTEQNSTNLDPQKEKSFNKYTLRKVAERDYVQCVLRPIRVKGYAILMKIAEEKKKLADKKAGIAEDGNAKKEVKTTTKTDTTKKIETSTETKTEKRKLEELKDDNKKTEAEIKKELEAQKKAEAEAKALKEKKRLEEEKKKAEHLKKLNDLDQKLRKEYGAKLLKTLKDVHFIESYEMDCTII